MYLGHTIVVPQIVFNTNTAHRLFTSVTILGDLLKLRQLLKAVGFIQFAQISHIQSQFLDRCHFSSEIVFGQLL